MYYTSIIDSTGKFITGVFTKRTSQVLTVPHADEVPEEFLEKPLDEATIREKFNAKTIREWLNSVKPGNEETK